MSSKEHRLDAFTAAYEYNLWSGRESRSGTGSDKVETREVVPALISWLKDNEIKSMVDLPCGDMNWMPEVLDAVSIDYTGCDIVPEIIKENRKRYPQYNFRILDAVTNAPVEAEVIFCRDMLGHLEDDEVKACLANFAESGAQWLITTTFPQIHTKREIVTGSWRPINMEHFGLMADGMLPDNPAGGKFLGIYDLDELYNG